MRSTHYSMALPKEPKPWPVSSLIQILPKIKHFNLTQIVNGRSGPLSGDLLRDTNSVVFLLLKALYPPVIQRLVSSIGEIQNISSG